MTRANILTLWSCFLVLEATAFVNAFVFDLKGGTVDAVRFQAAAAEWAEHGEWVFAINSQFFVQYLGTLYRVFGPNEFIATQFGILAIMAAAVLFIRILATAGLRTPAIALFLFLLWPSMALRVTTTLREPYMILSIMMTAYCLFRFYQLPAFRHAVGALLALSIGALFHKAIAVLLPFVVVWMGVQFIRKSSRHRMRRSLPLGFLVLGCAFFLLVRLAQVDTDIQGLKPLQSLITWDIDQISRVLDYKTGRDFRTTYDVSLSFDGPIAFITSGIQVFIHYMFMPFPWNVSHPYDLVAFLESLFRFIGLILILRFGVFGSGLPRICRGLWLFGFVICLIWAAGTSNYGTASRHHLTTNWIFLVAYIACFRLPRTSPARSAVA